MVSNFTYRSVNGEFGGAVGHNFVCTRAMGALGRGVVIRQNNGQVSGKVGGRQGTIFEVESGRASRCHVYLTVQLSAPVQRRRGCPSVRALLHVDDPPHLRPLGC